MKVLLVAPYRVNLAVKNARQDILPSEALLALAAVLRENGHQPIIRNFTTNVVEAMDNPTQYSYDATIKIIREEGISLVGISVLFGGDFPDALGLATHIKEHAPEVKIITGGIHATTFPREILSNCSAYDYIAIGEGETQMVEIANRVESGDMGSLEELSGFAFRDVDGSIKVNTDRDLLDYDSLPMPAWDLLDFTEYEMDLSNYFNPKGHDLKNIISVFSERGCPFKCTFCDLYMMQGRKVRSRGNSKFIDELQYLAEERGQRYFRFQDDNVLVNNRHIINICKEIVSRGLDIQFDIAGGYVNSYNDDVIDHLAEAGMVSTILNIEHGSEYIRDEIIKKSIETDKIYTVVESLRRYDICIGTNWIMGFPEDTNETLQETYDLIVDMKPDRANVGILAPYPGTPIFDQCIRDDLFIEKFDMENYWRMPIRPHQGEAVIKPYNMTTEELKAWTVKFDEVRYKFFGHRNPTFKLPVGYMRDDQGLVQFIS